MSTERILKGVSIDNGVDVRDASYTLDFSRFDKVESFDSLHYGTEEQHLASTQWRRAPFFYLR